MLVTGCIVVSVVGVGAELHPRVPVQPACLANGTGSTSL
jgi:hypothetical protein